MTVEKKATTYGVWVPYWKGRPTLRDRILNMYRTYGVYVSARDEPDRRCKTCRSMKRNPRDRSQHQCVMSAVPDWNWRVNWPACRLWEE